ncbi:MAG: hypothetical protein IKC88_03890 [Opitutales bacterium]|nr:hypothetical protein [Opitutales bacterium]
MDKSQIEEMINKMVAEILSELVETERAISALETKIEEIVGQIDNLKTGM